MAVLAAIVGGIWAANSSSPSAGGNAVIAVLATLGAGALGGFLWARFVTRRQTERDKKAMTDDEFLNLIAKCEQGQLDHALAWHFSIGNKQPGDRVMVVSLGLRDEFGGLQGVPADICTDQILGRLDSGALAPQRKSGARLPAVRRPRPEVGASGVAQVNAAAPPSPAPRAP
ncbi:MAG TPA: hypothetical protein PK280_08570 [Planctomycetota bacterium]|nr:hypothetical protein [Planctomycetota bacterium]